MGAALKVEWTTEWPMEPGWYWFYGHRCVVYPAQMLLVQFCHDGHSLYATAEGRLFNRREVGPHRWAKATLPDPPKFVEPVQP